MSQENGHDQFAFRDITHWRKKYLPLVGDWVHLPCQGTCLRCQPSWVRVQISSNLSKQNWEKGNRCGATQVRFCKSKTKLVAQMKGLSRSHLIGLSMDHGPSFTCPTGTIRTAWSELLSLSFFSSGFNEVFNPLLFPPNILYFWAKLKSPLFCRKMHHRESQLSIVVKSGWL